jgi:predicted NBD/HSP70 family sugar kinase
MHGVHLSVGGELRLEATKNLGVTRFPFRRGPGLSEALEGREIDRNLIAAAMNEASTNRRVRAVFDEYAAAVGRGLASLHTVYQPTVTVIGGSAAVCFPLLEDGIHRALERSTDYMVDVSIRAATLGDNAGAIGGALQISRTRSRIEPPDRTS